MYVIGLTAAIILFQIVAVPALLKKRNDFADVLWGPGFPLSALAAILLGPGFSNLGLRTLVIFGLVSVWAVRLFWHVGVRNLSHSEEDVRYAKWRREWGRTQVWRSYLQVWILQPLILFVILVPVLFAIDKNLDELSWAFWIGLGVWLIGCVFEVVSDYQLKAFKSDASNRGRLMTSGLWSWSRHPNYFGEVAQWWGIWIMLLDHPSAWWTIVGPLAITYLILKISGVPMLEDLMRDRPGFAEYAQRTSIFFPRPPKS